MTFLPVGKDYAIRPNGRGRDANEREREKERKGRYIFMVAVQIKIRALTREIVKDGRKYSRAKPTREETRQLASQRAL